MMEHEECEHGPRAGESIIFLHGGSMGGWMWSEQVEGLRQRHTLTPDLPGYRSRAAERWPGMARAADGVAALISERALGGRAHVVGLSLGGHVTLHLLRRHPEIVRSATISGVAAAGLGRIERALIAPQLPLWTKRWYWAMQAPMFRIPSDGREIFIASGAAPSAQTNRAMFAEVDSGTMPEGPFGYAGPVLAVAGQREAGSVRAAFAAIVAALPQTRTWIAPGMHHPWNAEDPALFTRMVREHTETGTWSGAGG